MYVAATKQEAVKMKNILLAFLFLVSITFTSAQEHKKSSTFISGLVGTAQVSNSGSGTNSPVAFSFGGSFGFPITGNLYLYTRGTYTSKSNFQSFYNTSFLNSQTGFSDELIPVTSSFSQLLLNTGLLYNFYISEVWTLGVNGGASFSVINQDAKLKGGHVISSVNNEAIWGYFGGMIVEKLWDEGDVSTFFEAQYNYARSDASYRISALNTMNFTFGVRYYLTRH
ncbi:hypothetical protein BMS3Abin03_02275 [bacterium BMS3Abin03]|nr:hypothetical protein BMS3Abin03_02275 [bacterium BMS3Abin03]